MNGKAASLTVNPPLPQKQLGRYRGQKGVYIIRQKDLVLYVGTSSDIYKTVMRLFQNGGKLSQYDHNKLTFEIVLTSFRTPSVESVLKRHFEPVLNRKAAALVNPSQHQKQQISRILDAYNAQTRFEVKGEHQTDSKN